MQRSLTMSLLDRARMQTRCYYCQKTGQVNSQIKTTLKNLADAEGETVTANSHPNDTAAVVPAQCSLPDEHAMTCHTAVPCVERKTPCEDVNVETRMRWDAGSTAPTGTECVKLFSDTCAGGICPRGSDQTAQNHTTVATMQLVTAPDDPPHGMWVSHILVRETVASCTSNTKKVT